MKGTPRCAASNWPPISLHAPSRKVYPISVFQGIRGFSYRKTSLFIISRVFTWVFVAALLDKGKVTGIVQTLVPCRSCSQVPVMQWPRCPEAVGDVQHGTALKTAHIRRHILICITSSSSCKVFPSGSTLVPSLVGIPSRCEPRSKDLVGPSCCGCGCSPKAHPAPPAVPQQQQSPHHPTPLRHALAVPSFSRDQPQPAFPRFEVRRWLSMANPNSLTTKHMALDVSVSPCIFCLLGKHLQPPLWTQTMEKARSAEK